VLGTNGGRFFSALHKNARFLSPKELQPSPQHKLLRRESPVRALSNALPLSYSDSRHWRDLNPQPFGYWFVEVSRAFTTPQNSSIRSALLTSFVRAHTPLVRIHRGRIASPKQSGEKFREELALTAMLHSPHESNAPEGQEVAVNFTIPGRLSRNGLHWNETI
jgi:hypothetical protein